MSTSRKTVLVTGAARRIGAAIARQCHQEGYQVLIHCNQSLNEAETLARSLNEIRPDSAAVIQANLLDTQAFPALITEATNRWGRLDGLVNNASTFYPTPLGQITMDDWEDLIGSNVRAPLFLSQAATPSLQQSGGCIVNIIDIHGQRPLENHLVYNIAKAGLNMMTRSLAKELGPDIRVNGVAPGTILWPEGKAALDESIQQQLVEKTPLKRQGSAEDIAKAVWFLMNDAPFVTGQILNVDGGRSL